MHMKYLIEKEFKQLLRDAFLPKLIVVFPVFMMILLPWAANMEVRNVRVAVTDNDRSSLSARLSATVAASGRFTLSGAPASPGEARRMMEAGEADVIMEIAPGFERRLMRGETAHVGLTVNTINGVKGGLGSAYLSAAIAGYAGELHREGRIPAGAGLQPAVTIAEQMRFNPNLSYKRFVVPALMVILLTLLCGFLPALNVVNEKERGSIEQINVTPVSRFSFVLAKLLPYWTVGFLVLTLCFFLAWLLYGILPAGHFALLYVCAAVFVLAVSGLGLVISNYSSTLQQAMFVMFFCLIVLMLTGGLFTPLRSMPGWAQTVTLFNPLRYMAEAFRTVYLRAGGLADLSPQLPALCAFALLFNLWAVVSYSKRK
jgi:ABC-2 type transport system permease protein